MNKLKLLILLLTLCFVTACDVEFDEDLRAYIDNIVDRTPLNFTLGGDGITEIDGVRSINLEHCVDGYSAEYTIKNDEDVDIQLNAGEAVTGNFTIAAFDAFTLKKGESFTFTITYNQTDENINKRVNHSYEFVDKDGRSFNFVIWATTKENPLMFYNTEGAEISVIDLGNWESNASSTFIIKNEGLATVSITSITSPSTDVVIEDTSGSTLAINEEREISLYFNYNSTEVDTSNDSNVGLFVYFDYRNSTNDVVLDVIAGGTIPLEVLDADSSPIDPPDGPVLNLGTYDGENAITQVITITNNTEKNYTLVVTKDSESSTGITFPSLEANITIEAGGTYPIQINFVPESEGDRSRNIYLYNESTGRVLTISVEGSY